MIRNRGYLAICLLLAAALPSFAQDATVTLPKDMSVKPGRLLKIAATTTGKTVKWCLPSDDADLIVAESGMWGIFSSTVPGKYKVFAWTAVADKPSDAAICTVTVEGTPPTPNPNPNPNPDPPIPTPDPPLSVLGKSIKDAFDQETEADKTVNKTKIASLYRAAAKQATEQTGLTNWGQLFSAMQASFKALGVNGKLMKVQGVLQSHMKTKFPVKADAALDAKGRELAASVYLEIADALDSFKPKK